MNKSELESKHLAELHDLAAEAGIERYRMLPRAELIAKLAGNGGEGGDGGEGGSSGRGGRGRGGRGRDRERGESKQSEKKGAGRESRDRDESSEDGEEASGGGEEASGSGEGRPRRRRRRRRWGRKRKDLRVHDLLLPGTKDRQAILYAESREGATTLLREVAAEISGASKGPDPVAVLVDPSPEELAEWKRDAPEAEIDDQTDG